MSYLDNTGDVISLEINADGSDLHLAGARMGTELLGPMLVSMREDFGDEKMASLYVALFGSLAGLMACELGTDRADGILAAVAAAMKRAETQKVSKAHPAAAGLH